MSGAVSAEEMKAQRLKKLKDLHLRRNEARKINHKEVVEEDKRNKLPANYEAKRRRVEWEIEDDRLRKEATEKGEDYDRQRVLEVGADVAEKYDRMKKKKNPDPGFADYEQATARQYNQLVRQIKPNMDDYEHKREGLGEAFYPTSNTIIQGLHKDTKQDVDRMVQDLEKQIDKRAKYSRRRMHNDDADIDYINERNMNFNKKLERFYGKYTSEIKQNLERGTAV